MSFNLDLPDWVPWWVPLGLLLIASLYGLVFLFMPFSVIGVKTRLEAIDVRLDEIQHEIRTLSLRLPEAGGANQAEFDDFYSHPPQSYPAAAPRSADPVITRPPIPPAVHDMYDDLPEDRPPPPPHTRPIRRGEPPPRQEPRAEPRLNWPR